MHGGLILRTWRFLRAPSPPVHEGLELQNIDTPGMWSSDSLVRGAWTPHARSPNSPVCGALISRCMEVQFPGAWSPGTLAHGTTIPRCMEPWIPGTWSHNSQVHGATISRRLEPWHCNGCSPRLPSEEFPGTCSVWNWISLPGPSLRKEPGGSNSTPSPCPAFLRQQAPPQDFTLCCFSIPRHLV